LKVYLGIDIGGTNVKIAVVSPRGMVRARGVLDTNPSDGPRRTFRRIHDVAGSLLGARDDVRGVGVGCAGLIDCDRGWLYSSPNLPVWENTSLRGIARRAFGVYTAVDNDANCAAYGEFRCGSSRGVRDLVFITLGTGVGGGVVCDGRLLRGAGNYAGELGHMGIKENGPRCHCGSRGCLEAYVGTSGLLRTARRWMRVKKSPMLAKWLAEGQRLTPRLIFEAARRKDPAARAAVSEAGEHLGVGIASLVNIFNPEAVVIGGGIAASLDLLQPRIEETIRQRAFPEAVRMVRILGSKLGNDATAVGAAMLAKDALCEGP